MRCPNQRDLIFLIDLKSLLVKFLIWRIKHISNKNFVLFLSGIVGIIAGLAAVTLKQTVHLIQKFLTQGFEYYNFLKIALPFFGIFLTVLLARYLLKDTLGHGITNILYAISKKSGIIRRTLMYSRMITSAVTVGLGGSVGLEAPIVVTGSAIGSNFGRLFHLDYKRRTLLIGCGAAGAISAIFNSPIAGVIFTVEVILMEVTITALIPILIASVTASLVSLTLLGDEVLFSFRLRDPFTAGDVPYYILLGLICGLISVYFTRTTFMIERLIGRIHNKIKKAILGGLALGLIIFVFPPLYGEGYNTIKTLLAGQEIQIFNTSLFQGGGDSILITGLFILGVLLIKPVASALTVGAGGSGGIFAPSLFIGGLTGFLYAYLVNIVFGEGTISTSNFLLVGMCGVMSGVLQAPLTAIFLIAEITSGYTLFVPLMLVSALAFSSSSYFEKYSIYTKHLIEQGDLIQYDKDRQVLSLINLKKIIEKDLLIIKPDATLKELTDLVKISQRNIFPVVNDDGELVGIVTLDDIREKMFDREARENLLVQTLMHNPPTQVTPQENMQSVMSKFELTGAWNLPVIENGKYIGFVSKSRIFNSYRKKLVRQAKE